MIKKVIVFLLIICSTYTVRAQQDAMFSHYMFNTQSINPGYVGSREVLSVMTVLRSQWINFDGAPRTQTLSVNSPLFDDQLGLYKKTLDYLKEKNAWMTSCEKVYEHWESHNYNTVFGNDLKNAKEKAYKRSNFISWEGIFKRDDIGDKEINNRFTFS